MSYHYHADRTFFALYSSRNVSFDCFFRISFSKAKGFRHDYNLAECTAPAFTWLTMLMSVRNIQFYYETTCIDAEFRLL